MQTELLLPACALINCAARNAEPATDRAFNQSAELRLIAAESVAACALDGVELNVCVLVEANAKRLRRPDLRLLFSSWCRRGRGDGDKDGAGARAGKAGHARPL